MAEVRNKALVEGQVGEYAKGGEGTVKGSWVSSRRPGMWQAEFLN